MFHGGLCEHYNTFLGYVDNYLCDCETVRASCTLWN
jgi:hypothetical protein